MGKMHGNAGLTEGQRAEVQRLYGAGGVSQSALARRFCVHRRTIARWVERTETGDRSSVPHQPRQVVTEAYRAAVLAYRGAHPEQGPIRIAYALRSSYPEANRGTVYQILRAAGLCGRAAVKKE